MLPFPGIIEPLTADAHFLSVALGGFVISYFQVTWAQAQGTKISFGVQAAVCAAAFLIIVFVVLFGKKIRVKSGPLKFTTV